MGTYSGACGCLLKAWLYFIRHLLFQLFKQYRGLFDMANWNNLYSVI